MVSRRNDIFIEEDCKKFAKTTKKSFQVFDRNNTIVIVS